MDACRTLLNRRALGLQDGLIMQSMLNTLDSGAIDPENNPNDLERLLKMATTPEGQTKTGILAGSKSSAASLGLSHRALYAFSRQSNLQGALRSFLKMQSLMDTNRERLFVRLAAIVNERQRPHEDTNATIADTINNFIPGVYSEAPVYVLATLLDLVTDAGCHELGNWLLFSEDVDGPTIPASLYSEPALEPALFHFAEITGNGELFAKITEKMAAPLPTNILRTLFHCQVALGKWDAAEEVLRHFQSEPDEGIAAKDVMAVARAILQTKADRSTPYLSRIRGQALLRDLLQGKLSRPYNASQARDYSELRTLTQSSRILRSLPGDLGDQALQYFGDHGRVNAPIEIPTEAFNILLEGVVDVYGPLVGRKLWSQWCRPLKARPGSAKFRALLDVGEEKVVEPSLQTMRILMRPIIKAGKIETGEDSDLVAWAIETGQLLGLSAKEIALEMPGLVARPMPNPGELSVRTE